MYKWNYLYAKYISYIKNCIDITFNLSFSYFMKFFFYGTFVLIGEGNIFCWLRGEDGQATDRHRDKDCILWTELTQGPIKKKHFVGLYFDFSLMVEAKSNTKYSP